MDCTVTRNIGACLPIFSFIEELSVKNLYLYYFTSRESDGPINSQLLPVGTPRSFCYSYRRKLVISISLDLVNHLVAFIVSPYPCRLRRYFFTRNFLSSGRHTWEKDVIPNQWFQYYYTRATQVSRYISANINDRALTLRMMMLGH